MIFPVYDKAVIIRIAAVVLLPIVLAGGAWGQDIAEAPSTTFRAPSGFGVEFRHPIPDLIGDLISTERGDPKLEASVPFDQWYSPAVRKRFGAWGPSTRAYEVLPGLDEKPVDWKRERVIAAALRFQGYEYQHHHVPNWDPPANWPWKEVKAGKNGKGVDCSNFTSFVYNQGFGVQITSHVVRQSEPATVFRQPGDQPISIRKIELPEKYKDRIQALKTGDLLFIKGSPTSGITHVVIWVGEVGRSASGAPLVIDSHGPGVKDDEGQSIPGGVQLRPFREKSWYNRCASHAFRLFEELP